MAKTRTEYVCDQCGGTVAKWAGKCPHCGAWNTLKEFKVQESASAARFGLDKHRSRSIIEATQVIDLADVEAEELPRIVTGLEEFDRVMGGGLVPGGVSLIGGDPGIGKSTLLLQVMSRLVLQGRSALYVSGEESSGQVAMRAKRLAIDPHGLQLMSEIELEKIEDALIARKPEFVVIDSIQTLFSSALDSAPGSVTQVRECSARLTRLAKTSGATLFFVGHVTKDGALAGPRVLEHIVDTVLYFEGDTHSNFRLVRAFKNRFGAVNELGVFARHLESVGDLFVRTPRQCAGERRHGDTGRDAPLTRGSAGFGGRHASAESEAPERGARSAAACDAPCGTASARGVKLLRSGRFCERRGRREDYGARERLGGDVGDCKFRERQGSAARVGGFRRSGARR